MAITRLQGPIVVPGAGPFPAGIVPDYNDTPGPSMFAQGVALLDNRFGPFAGGDVTNAIPGLYAPGAICVVDAAPATKAANNIAAAQVPVAGTAMTLASASTGITILSSALALFQGWGPIPSGALVMDGSPALVEFAQQAGGVAMYDPRTAVTRTLVFTSAGNDSGATAHVVGYDFYGTLVHETVTLANATTASSKKALKAVVSITPAGTLSGSNLSVGTNDVFGFQLASYEFAFADIYWNSALITATTGYTAAVTTNPATATTGDVRGTYATQSASNGTIKLQVFITPQAWNATAATLWGVAQV